MGIEQSEQTFLDSIVHDIRSCSDTTKFYYWDLQVILNEIARKENYGMHVSTEYVTEDPSLDQQEFLTTGQAIPIRDHWIVLSIVQYPVDGKPRKHLRVRRCPVSSKSL